MGRSGYDADDVTGIEEQFWAAAGDPDFYRSHFADDGLIALAMGVMDKTQTVEAMGSAQPWAEFRLDDRRRLDIADDVASLTYRATARRESDDADYTAVVSSVYVRRNGDWTLVLHQQTPVT